MQKIKNLLTPKAKGLIVFIVGIIVIALGVILPVAIPKSEYQLCYNYESSYSYGDKIYDVVIYDREGKFEDGISRIDVRIKFTKSGEERIEIETVTTFDIEEDDDEIIIKFRLTIDGMDSVYYRDINGMAIEGVDPHASVGGLPQENEKDNRRLSIIIPASIIGGLMTISGIITMIVASNTVNTLLETGTDEISQIAENFKEANELNQNSKKSICEYCGGANKPDATKCENCGARLK